MMVIRSAELETVCGIKSDLPKNTLPEVAFCGRSNVGKSSLINTILSRKSLARTSSVPGKTQTLNFYNINNSIYLVDLPGYGYTEASKKVNEKWGEMIERYLRESLVLSSIFLLVDMRHAPSRLDIAMADTIKFLGRQLIVIATKSDKLKRSERKKNLALIEKTLSMGENDILVPFSSVTKEGKDTVLDLLSQVAEGFSNE